MSRIQIQVAKQDILGHELFPLPLVPMEKFMLWDDSEAHPKSFRISMNFRGRIDAELFVGSFQLAIRRHALLCATIQKCRGGFEWFIPETASFEFHFGEGSFETCPFTTRLDLTQSPGVRVWLNPKGEETEVNVEFHHAACDGVGCRGFLMDWLWAYESTFQAPKGSVEFIPLEPERLLARGSFKRVSSKEGVRSTTLWEKIVHAYHFHFRGPHPIPEMPTDPPTNDMSTAQQTFGQHFYRRTWSEEETSRILEEAKSRSLSLNSWMVGALTFRLSEWSRQQVGRDDERRLRILIPTSMRQSRELRLPATNRMGFGFVSLQQKDCPNLDATLVAIEKQLESIVSLQLGLDFVELFSLASNSPWLTKTVLAHSNCFATMAISNLGNLSHALARKVGGTPKGETRVGDAVLTSVFGAPPLRPGTRLGVGICLVGNRLCVGMATDQIPAEVCEEWTSIT